MAPTNMQLKVVKTDGTVEQYLHTKVIGTISNALALVEQSDVNIAEHLAEVVTYFLYHKQKRRRVASDEIFSIIKAVLTATNYEDAALALSDYRFERRLKRSRIEVVSVDIQRLADARLLDRNDRSLDRARWDKSRIVDDLMAEHNIGRQAARTIASMVEEKVFGMGLTVVPVSLIKQLVMADAAAVLRAQEQLQTV
jgi:transcriptional regulator NrdR family protein